IGAVRDAIDAGKGLGPRILLACLVDGTGPGSLGTNRIRAAEEIPDVIKSFQAAHCAQVKIYSSLDPRLIGPLTKAAHAPGMTVPGHVPNGIGAVHAVEAGQDQINHLHFLLRAFAAPDEPDKSLTFPVLQKAIAAFDPTTPAARKLAEWFAGRGTVVDP